MINANRHTYAIRFVRRVRILIPNTSHVKWGEL
jgi:hypothetical protein